MKKIELADVALEQPKAEEKVLSAHMALGLDLIGSKTSLHADKYEITEGPNYLKFVSKGSGRIIKIPHTNIKGWEMMPADGKPARSSASARAAQAMEEQKRLHAKKQQVIEPKFEPPSVISEDEQKRLANEARVKAAQARKAQAEAENAKT